MLLSPLQMACRRSRRRQHDASHETEAGIAVKTARASEPVAGRHRLREADSSKRVWRVLDHGRLCPKAIGGTQRRVRNLGRTRFRHADMGDRQLHVRFRHRLTLVEVGDVDLSGRCQSAPPKRYTVAVAATADTDPRLLRLERSSDRRAKAVLRDRHRNCTYCGCPPAAKQRPVAKADSAAGGCATWRGWRSEEAGSRRAGRRRPLETSTGSGRPRNRQPPRLFRLTPSAGDSIPRSERPRNHYLPPCAAKQMRAAACTEIPT